LLVLAGVLAVKKCLFDTGKGHSSLNNPR